MHINQRALTGEGCSQPDLTATREEAVPVRGRVEAIDVVRGIALFGVLLVNLTTEFRVSIFQQFLEAAPSGSGIDLLLAKFVSAGLEGKAFSMFSLLFGVGLAIQFERLTKRGRPFYWLVRRLVVLLGFGLVHLLLIWNGDILTEYAIAGLFVLPFLLLRTRYLATAAFVFLLIYTMQSSMWTIRWPAAEMLKEHIAVADAVYSMGSYADIVRFSFRELPILLPLHLYVLPRTIALFLFGMLFWRIGVFAHPARFRSHIRVVAAAGILAGAALTAISGRGWFSGAAVNVGPVMLAVGYAAAILALMGSPRVAKILGAFAPLGRMAFTNYLFQSLICGFVFFGYGLGRFGHMAVAPAFGLGVMIYLGQMALSAVWLRHYRYGPVEWVWRTLMYGRMQPMAVR